MAWFVPVSYTHLDVYKRQTYPYADRMEVVKKYTGIPEQINSLCVIPVGYPAMPHSPKDKWDASKVHMNKW